MSRSKGIVTLIDCDGVIADFTKMVKEVAQSQFGIEIKTDDGKNWDYFSYPEVIHIRDELWKFILGTPGLIRGLSKFDYTDTLITSLREIGDVICCTSAVNSGFYPEERIRWLMEELEFDRNDIIIAHKKYLICADIFIDNKPDNVIKWADYWYNNEGVPVLWKDPGPPKLPIKDERIFQTSCVQELMDHLHDERKIA